MKPNPHFVLVDRMMAEDEASLSELNGRILAMALTCSGTPGRTPNIQESKQSAEWHTAVICLKRGLEGLKLKIDAMTDCILEGRPMDNLLPLPLPYKSSVTSLTHQQA